MVNNERGALSVGQIAALVAGSILVVLASVTIGLALGRHEQKQPIEPESAVQAPAPTTVDNTAATDQQKTEQQKQLNECLDIVNKAITDALDPSKTSDMSAESRASYVQQVLQVQQTQTAQCQAKYPVGQ